MNARRPLLLSILVTSLVADALADQESLVWVQRVNGPADMSDSGADVAVDANGDVVVGGVQTEQLGPNLFGGRMLIARYAADGTPLWTRTFGPAGATGAAVSALELDSAGNAIATGPVGGDDWAVVKYAPDGTQLWASVFPADSTFVTAPADLYVDAAGNAYVTGGIGLLVPDTTAALVLKYDPDGSLLWSRTYLGPGGASDGEAIVADELGNVYVAGATAVAGSANEMSLLKLDAAGNPLWLRTFGYAGAFTFDRARALAFTPGGDLIVAGQVGGNTAAGEDVAVQRYDPDGNLQWTRTYDGPGAGFGVGNLGSEVVSATVVDAAGDAYVLGWTETAPANRDVLLLKYAGDGTELWDVVHGGSAQQDDRGRDLALDPAGGVVAAGSFVLSSGGEHLLAARWSAGGQLVWQGLYRGPQGGSGGFGVALDGSSGGILSTGRSPGPGTSFDLVTVRFDPVSPTHFCDGKTSSLGCVPYLSTAGTPSASSTEPFTIRAHDVLPDEAGFLLYGLQAGNLSFHGGVLCVKAPVTRLLPPKAPSAGGPPPCSASLARDFNARIQSGVDPRLSVGRTVAAQWYQRDPADPAGFGDSLTNGVRFQVCP